MTSASSELPEDENEALRAAELERMRVEHEIDRQMHEPLCAVCLRRLSVCVCGDPRGLTRA